jgi:hypothetical protein
VSRVARVAGVVTVALALSAPPSGASVPARTTNACKLLKRGEIEDALGQQAAKARKGISSQVSTCEWAIDREGDLPEGVIATFIQRVGAEEAFEASHDVPGAEEVPELGGDSYYDPDFGAMYVLKDERLMFVQGVFVEIGTSGDLLDRRDELVTLTKIARKRL